MFEDKLEQKRNVDKQAMEEILHLFGNMVGSGKKVPETDNSIASIKVILKELGVEKIDFGKKEREGESAADFLHHYQILSRKIHLTGEWWHTASGPILAKDSSGEFVALIPSALGYRRFDALANRKKRARRSNVKDLEKEAVCFYKELPYRPLTIKDLYHYAFSSLKVADYVVVVCFCTIVVLLGMLVPVANKLIFSEVVPSGDLNGLLPVCGFLLGATLSAALFGITRNQALFRIKDKLNANLQAAVMARVYKLPNRFFKEFSSGDLSIRALSVVSIYQLITNELLMTVAVGVFSLMYIFIAFVYAKSLVWFVTLVIIIYFAYSIIVLRAYSKQFNEVLPQKTSSQSAVFSLISGIQKIKSNGAEIRGLRYWAGKFAKSEVMTADAPWIVRYRKAFAMLITNASTCMAFYLAWRYNISISDYIAFMAAFGVMLVALDNLQMLMQEVARIIPQLKLVNPIIEAVPEDGDESVIVKNLSGSIEINNLSFRYGAHTPLIVNDITMKIRAGEYVGIVGMSGCGKSTLMKLMIGLERANTGSVFYDQYNLDEVNLNSLHRHMGYFPQDNHIFPDTILDNIKVSSPASSEEDVWEAARIACIDDDIRNMPLQMLTYLGEGGSGLSGGQCQRIMIARAVLSKPKIIFFDEATSALDNITQKQVIDNLASLNCTRIVIAHRISTIEDCDRVLALDKGEIIEDGTPDELKARRGLFYQLSLRQSMD